MKAALYLYAAATIVAGIVNLVWGDFDTGHQPIQAFGDVIPGRGTYAHASGIWLVAGGLALLLPKSTRAGAIALAILYTIFAIFWLPRYVTATHVLGLRADVIAGVSGGVAQQLILVCAAVLVYVWSSESSARNSAIAHAAVVLFGICSIAFGAAHLTGPAGVAAMVPRYLPFGGVFWAMLTGVAFVAAGIGIVTGALGVLAARLLAVMLLVFSVLVLGPQIGKYAHEEAAWGANAYNLTAVAAAWIVASWLALRRSSIRAA